MNDEAIDRAMQDDAGVVPSSGFVRSVMNAVTAEAPAASPISFPWQMVGPAIAASLLFMVAPFFGMPRHLPVTVLRWPAGMADGVAAVRDLASRPETREIGLALLLTLLIIEIPRRIAFRP